MNNHVLNFQDNWVFVFHDEMFQQPVTAQNCKMQIYPLVSKTEFLKTMSFFQDGLVYIAKQRSIPARTLAVGLIATVL